VSAGSDTISLQATASGPGTTFSLSNITGGVIGNTVTDGTNGGAVKTVDQLVSDINGNAALAGNILPPTAAARRASKTNRAARSRSPASPAARSTAATAPTRSAARRSTAV